MAAFSKMTEAERERLEMLIEEAGEIVTIGTKILRHGYTSYHPDDPAKVTNRDHLEREVGDLLTVFERMVSEGDVEGDVLMLDLNARWKSKLKWTHHQPGSPE